MNACLRSKLYEFSIEDIPQLLQAMEEIRLHLVRLERRNRPQNDDEILIASPKKLSITREKTECKQYQRFWINEDGRLFRWIKKEDLSEEFPCRQGRRRKTHRGKRKRNNSPDNLVKKSISTLSQMVPTASHLPQRIKKLHRLLYDILIYDDEIMNCALNSGVDLVWDARLIKYKNCCCS